MADEQKTVAVVVPSGTNGTDTVLEEVTIIPGTTAQDVLNSIGRGSGYILGTLSGNVFGARDLLFAQVNDADKLAITPSAEAGASAPAPRRGGLLARLGRVFVAGSSGPATEVQVSRTRTAAPAAARQAAPAKAVTVRPDARPAWQTKGWKEKAQGIYEGYYGTPFGPCRGRVEFDRYGFRRMYIWNPPRELWTANHPKWPCFEAEGHGRYQIHMHIPPASVDSAILNVERMFGEAHRMLQRGLYA